MALVTDDLSTLQGHFLASLNHEVRTPLSGILGMTDLLLETPLSGEQKEYVDSVRLCAENLLEVFSATLEFSALSANRVVADEAEFPIRETLECALEEFLYKAQSKGLRLIRRFEDSLPETAIGDAPRLRQILTNILRNAIKFTNDGEVEVTASASRRSDGGALLSVGVRDTGIGIPEDKLGSIFESFSQVDGGLSRSYNGLGLGLAVSKKLAALLRGEIAVESKLGKGSVFTLCVPLRIPVEIHASRAVEPAVPRILVVDDDSVGQLVAARMLSRRAFQVDCANSGPAALEAANKRKYDVIFMDLQMPGMDGFETALRIHNLPGYAGTPIVALTANCSAEYRETCFKQGMQGFLSKPVQSADLIQAAEKFTARSEAAPV
jgi:CheY-like chemotaxis protein